MNPHVVSNSINTICNPSIHETLGKHVLVELNGCPNHLLNDADYIEKVFSTAVELAGAHVITKVAHRFEPYGVSIVFVLSESHLSIHTWPERGYAAVDMYTCGTSDPATACKYIVQELNATSSYNTYVQRGLPCTPCTTSDLIKDPCITFYHEIRDRS